MFFVFNHQHAAHHLDPRQLNCESASLSDAWAFGKHAAAMLFDDGMNNEQAQTRALHARHHQARRAIEALEDALKLRSWNSNTAVGDPDYHVFFVNVRYLH